MSGLSEADRAIRSAMIADGPIPLGRYMALANAHYYATRDPFGAGGDFITAPEISQMFGELLGLWAVAVWQMLGAPRHMMLAELGPGRGTLMVDAVRAGSVVPAFRAAIDVHLVETSPRLRDVQGQALDAVGITPTWHEDIAGLPDGPAVIFANEFFDALPIEQLVRGPRGWHQICVGLDADGRYVRRLAPDPVAAPDTIKNAPEGSLIEIAPARAQAAAALGARLVRHPGAALIIDYGSMAPITRDTFQAIEGHKPVDPFVAPGTRDLTSHVDFAALARAAAGAGASVHGPVTQRDFLLGLGIETRSDALLRRATPEEGRTIVTARERLLDPAPAGMGALFKVLAIAPRGWAQMPGLVAGEGA